MTEGTMAYHSKFRRHGRLAPMSGRQTFAAQGEDLARKFVVDSAVALATRAGANYFCTRPNPDYALCNVFNDVADKQDRQENHRAECSCLGDPQRPA